MPVYKIHHITKYEYERAVTESVNQIRIFPFESTEQEILKHDLAITDHPEVQQYFDYWGNRIGLFNILQPHRQLVVESKLLVRTTLSSQLQLNFQSGWQQLKDETSEQLQFIELTTPEMIEEQEQIKAIAEKIYHVDKSVARAVEEASEYIYKNFKYTKGITTIETTVDEILRHRGGVCQDFAHLLLQILRTLEIPCRYVSGYICPNKNGMRGEGATHAWVEAWIPQWGWAGIDPTNNVWITNNHVKLAVGRDFRDCTPVKGTFKGSSKHNLQVFVSIAYEDGHIFEETNLVQQNKMTTAEPPELVSEAVVPRQQQQQQQ